MQKIRRILILSQTMGDVLTILSIYTVIIPLLTGLVLWKFQEANARLMLILIALASFTSIYPEFFPDNKSLVYNLYIIADILLWSLMLYSSSRINFVRYIILFFFLLFLLIYIWYVYSHGHIAEEFFSDLVCLDSVLQVICVLLFFYEKYQTEQILNLEKDPMFWFCLAILLYAPCTYLRFALYNKNTYLNNFHSIINILLYIMISVGFTVKFSMIKKSGNE